ncbi:MAG TPA: glycoside hydrolase family 3 N-terminal domain-containing protein [Alphaproteobacteria bacterium]|nr:glycoside hydrolase family 3 N-terminal domain-containing protein [Alphaproteobacteria bacterium]
MFNFRKLALLVLITSLACGAEGPYPKPSAVRLTPDGRRWAERTLKQLTLEEKVGQMLQVRYFMDFQNFDAEGYRQIRETLQRFHVGGIVLTVHVDGAAVLKSLPLEAAAVTNRLQRDSKLPLLIAADFERGLSMRMNSVPMFPDAMAFGATGNTRYAERFGAITAEESRAVGIHWSFWPVADVNSNPENPIINTRSYGEDPNAVGDMAAAFIRGARAHGLLTSAKHFPGHGDTSTDSHLGVAKVDGSRERLEQVELPPFRKTIDAGVDSVMVAHVTVPGLESDPNKVASTSHAVIGDILQGELGFKGVVITDAMEMHALTGLYPPEQGNPSARGAVDAVKAGNDIVMLPTDLEAAFNGIVAAVRRGEISQARINSSVLKILELKASVGLHRSRLVDMQQVSYIVSKPEDMIFAQQVADDAVTLVRDNSKVIPLSQPAPTQASGAKPDAPLVVLVLSDSVRGSWGRALENAIKAKRADVTFLFADSRFAGVLTPQILAAVRGAERVVVAAYVAPSAAKQVMVDGKLINTVSLDPATGDLLRQVLEAGADKTAVVALGNPYLIQSFPNIQTYLCTFSAVPSSELSAVKVLFGEIKPRGHLPVTLPGIAQRGYAVSADAKSDTR